MADSAFSKTGVVTPLPANLGGTGIGNNVASTQTIVGSFPMVTNLTASTNITLPVAGVITNMGSTYAVSRCFYNP